MNKNKITIFFSILLFLSHKLNTVYSDRAFQNTDETRQSIKHHFLEPYKDFLDNTEFKRENQRHKLMKFLPSNIKYMVDYGTKDSTSLHKIYFIQTPFIYKLKENLKKVKEPKEEIVDLLETFNYLIGLKVKNKSKKIKNKKMHSHSEKRSLNIIKEFSAENHNRYRKSI